MFLGLVENGNNGDGDDDDSKGKQEAKKKKTILIINGAGGVSRKHRIATQLARKKKEKSILGKSSK